jgi:hypothetical protein
MRAGLGKGEIMLGAHHHHSPISRRALLRGLAGTGAAVVGAGAVGRGIGPARAADDPRPKPIPGGIVVGGQGYHVNNPGPMTGNDPTAIADQSSLYDFDGVVACSHIQGTGVGTDKTTGISQPMAFDTDMRFMQGTYIGMDGKRREGSFGFI